MSFTHCKEIRLELVEPVMISWKLVTRQQTTSKENVTSMDGYLIPRHGHVILVIGYPPCFDNCQLTTTSMCNIMLQTPTLARKRWHSPWFPRVVDGRAGLRSRDYRNFSNGLLVFSVMPFEIDQNKNQNRSESGKWKEVNMQRPSPRFRSEEYFVYEISEEMFCPNL